MKTCFKCGEQKPYSEFYKDKGASDGFLGKCKICTCADVRAYRQANIDAIRAYDRARSDSPRRKENARRLRIRYRLECRDKLAKYRATYKERHPEKRAAQIALCNAIRDGRLEKLPCEVCGSKKVQGHHDDYSQPLKVRWLCIKHHGAEHRRINAKLRTDDSFENARSSNGAA